MNKDFVFDLDLVITNDNIQDIAEIVALSVLRRCAIYCDHKLDSMYKGLIRDINRNGTLTQIYSDGYDYVQTAICFLLEHLGERLGDMTDRFKHRVTIYNKCCCIVNCAIQRQVRYNRSLDDIDNYSDYEQQVGDDIDIEECYAEVDEQIQRMRLTKGEKETLDCYMGGMRFVEIGKLLSVDLSTIWRRRASMKRKYLEFVGV